MAEAAATPQAAPDPSFVATARRLLRTGLTGSLATAGADGAPHVSFVAYAQRMDGAPLFLFSGLSAHTKNLAKEPRFALLVGDAPKAEGDPLDSPRVTLLGRLAKSAAPQDRARFLRRHPAAEMYAGFPDFAIFAAELADIHFVGGFARARSLAVREVLLDLAGAAGLAEAEAGIVAHMNQDHAAAAGLYATRLLGQPAGPWRLTGIDPEGCDLRALNRTARLDFGRRIATPAEAREMLVSLARQARASAGR
jgi:putative heme iron utilization protein